MKKIIVGMLKHLCCMEFPKPYYDRQKDGTTKVSFVSSKEMECIARTVTAVRDKYPMMISKVRIETYSPQPRLMQSRRYEYNKLSVYIRNE